MGRAQGFRTDNTLCFTCVQDCGQSRHFEVPDRVPDGGTGEQMGEEAVGSIV